jgi:hypothetical protein
MQMEEVNLQTYVNEADLCVSLAEFPKSPERGARVRLCILF